jgi:bifunctional non-homologous end joining protein LigD
MGLSRESDVERERQRTPVYLMVFDVLHADGTSLLRTPYTERRERLFELVTESEHIMCPRPSKEASTPPSSPAGSFASKE